uniref:Uncharacterized protein n=1 Tax=Octopus bimaculoides TaxID=37653 RepID=A0A0L8GL77_OCTBM
MFGSLMLFSLMYWWLGGLTKVESTSLIQFQILTKAHFSFLFQFILSSLPDHFILFTQLIYL